VATAVFLGVVALGVSARADDATDQARKRYETGLELFYAREHAQALVEFQRAHEIKPRPATLFMMAQCEYLLGALTTAREHYESYLRDSPAGEFVEVAKDRIESINRRPATLVINCVPDNVDVRVTPEDVPGAVKASTVTPPAAPIVGQAPNNFSVPRGHWRVTLSKPLHKSQSIVVDLEVAETKPLFFKLDPISAWLEIETVPSNATLWVNGNRARNPYRRDVPPGQYEVFAEATDYENRTDQLLLGPGERRIFSGSNSFQLRYVQRSGRPELLVASGLMGAFVGAGAVRASLNRPVNPDVSSVSLTVSGAFVGAIAAALVANSTWPAYIPDNRALFSIGAMWIGAAEGALAGVIVFQAHESQEAPTIQKNFEELGPFKPPPYLATAAFVGSLPGLAVGITAGALLNYKAPTYGRVALIQSAAAGGALLGALTAVALQRSSFGFERGVERTENSGTHIVTEAHRDDVIDLSIPSAIGLNVGLGAGLLGAYLPDQSLYGPTWRRIALIDLAAGAGALAGGIVGCVSEDKCVGTLSAESGPRAHAASFALLGGGLGLAAGILLTRNVDRTSPVEKNTTAPPPMVTILPSRASDGRITPLLGALGAF
jgi:hypothetical protein